MGLLALIRISGWECRLARVVRPGMLVEKVVRHEATCGQIRNVDGHNLRMSLLKDWAVHAVCGGRIVRPSASYVSYLFSSLRHDV